MTESWTSNPYNKFQCLQMYTVYCPANFTLLRLVNIMHSWRELLLLPLGFKAQLRYFRLLNNSLSGFSTTVWPNVYSQYSFCMLFRSQIFWLTLLHTLIFLGLLNIYISICSKYIKPNIYNSMYLQKKTHLLHPSLSVFPKAPSFKVRGHQKTRWDQNVNVFAESERSQPAGRLGCLKQR